MYDPVRPDVSFPSLEEEILGWWTEHDIPGKVLSHRQGADEFVFYEGPPYANNPPGIHHVLARAYKDVYNRYQSARGRYVPRKAGWDCHGLPVEVEVEKSLGFEHKKQILDYGIDRFNELCRTSVVRYIGEWERMSDRMAYWLDYRDAYQTMSNEYIESVWWSLAELHRRGLLYEGEKIAPYCPRCETPLSDHELGQPDAYREVSDPSVTVGFRIVSGPLEGAELAIWTTTPWTLVSNLAVAVHPDVGYAVVSWHGRRLVVAEALVDAVFGEEAAIERTLSGRDLVGSRYTPPFDFAASSDLDVSEAWQVLGAGFVTTDEGTGLVHLAPAFGADDLEAAAAAGIPTFNPVDASGTFDERITPYAGRFVKDADEDIVRSLDERGLLVRAETYLHSYPHCWRCKSPLLYYALTSWYIRTTQVRDRMLAANADVNWVPEHIRDGRFGNWLENNVDWSLSRFRFWGTPLPIWRCHGGHDTSVDSVAELEKRSGRTLAGLDLHRPHVDEVTFPCPECGREARRVPDVIDVWYDSGAMPFAQYGYPHRNVEVFRRRFPGDFISEAIDQTRGWFYSLMAEGVLLFDRSPYRNVVCLELILDEQGMKMSKSRPEFMVDAREAFDRYGADAVRFLLIGGSPPASPKRVSMQAFEQVVRGPFLTLWNVYRLFVLYANIDQFHPGSWPDVAPALRPPLDRWALSELHQTIAEVGEALDDYDATRAARRLVEYVDDLSNWYVRRSRRRFWREATTEEEKADKASAYWTLWTSLVETSKLLAPFAPFLAEALYRNLVVNVNERAPESVHLADFPKADGSLIDPEVATGMAAVRSLVSLGRSARTEAGVKVRQPLGGAVLLVPPELADLVRNLEPIIADELNVRSISYAEQVGTLVKVTLKPDFRNAGPAFGPKVRELADALATASDPHAIAAVLEAGDDVDVTLASGEVLRVGPEHVEVRNEPAEGTAFAYQAPFGVSLELEIGPALRTEGLVREFVHQAQNVRRDGGLEVTDRIRLRVAAPDDVADAIRTHEAYVTEELLASSVELLGTPEGMWRTVNVDGLEVHVDVERA